MLSKVIRLFGRKVEPTRRLSVELRNPVERQNSLSDPGIQTSAIGMVVITKRATENSCFVIKLGSLVIRRHIVESDGL